MKRSILPLTLVLPILAASAASAQLTTIRFAAPVNPIAGLPKLLPSPMTGPLVGTGISLPSLVPALTPSMSLAAAPIPAYLPPMRMPAREGQVPAAPGRPSRDGVVNPLRRVMPDVVVRFSRQPDAAKPDASKDKLDEAFDGAPAKPTVGLPGRGTISSGRRVSLPEWDLERELGI